jgi:hypothetical protein
MFGLQVLYGFDDEVLLLGDEQLPPLKFFPLPWEFLEYPDDVVNQSWLDIMVHCDFSLTP